MLTTNMKGQSYDILGPYDKGEHLPSTPQKMTRYSIAAFIGIGLLASVIELKGITHFIMVSVIFLAGFGWMVGSFLSYMFPTTGKFNVIGKLTFYDEHVEFDNRSFTFSEVSDIDFQITGYQGAWRHFRGGLYGWRWCGLGGNNYLTIKTVDQEHLLRIFLKSQISYEHLLHKLKPWLKRKITNGKSQKPT